MKTKRRNFLKMTGLAGLSVLGGCNAKGHDSQLNTAKADIPQLTDEYEKKHRQLFNMSGYTAPPIETVRVGIIGLGQRGPHHAKTMSRIEGVQIKALCDLRPEKAHAVKQQLAGAAHNPDIYTGSDDEWKKLCQRDDLDLVIITTPWYMHTEMAVYAMNHGKHVATEVPAAGTIQECWQLIETAEQTRRHLMMMENYAYMPFQLLTLNMARQGFFGEIVHGDCAYNTSKMGNNFNKNFYWNMWWLRQYTQRKGNIYPTHGLSPVAQIMDINRGDRFDFLVSVESKDFMIAARAKELADTDSFFEPFVGQDYRGNMNVTTIRTKQGRTIMLQHDATSPSPHNLIHGIYGTNGAALLDPAPPKICTGDHQWASPEQFEQIKEKYTPAIFRRMSELAKDSGHGGSDLLLGWHIIDCLHNGLPSPIS
jgi:predicted dehydrogenase